MNASPRPILLTGADGQVGWELRRALAPLGAVHATRRAELDLADTDALRAAVRSLRPAAIVNAAAYTAVDRAEAERDLAFAINAGVPAVLAEEAARLAAPIVHYSTDYVYAGDARAPYREDALTGPLGVYGASKLAGDEAVIASGAAHLIVRTCWVYAARGRNFLRTMLRLAREGAELRVVADQTGSPTPARLIADVTARLLAREGDALAISGGRTGVYHVAARGAATWHDFASAIVAADARQRGTTAPPVRAITTTEFPTPARRPSYSALDCTKLERTFGLVMPEWREQLYLVMETIA